MARLHRFLKIFFFVQLGSCSARVFSKYLDFVYHPELYAIRSTPWYYDITLTVILTAITALLTAIAYFAVGHILKKRQQKQTNPESAE